MLEKRKIIIFGAGIRGRRFLGQFKDENVEIAYICDNDPQKVGSKIDDVMIINPKELLSMKSPLVMISSLDDKEIRRQLEQMGIENIYTGNDIHWLIMMNDFMNPSIDMEIKKKHQDFDKQKADVTVVLLGSNHSDELRFGYLGNQLVEFVSYQGRNTVINGKMVLTLHEKDYVRSNIVESLRDYYLLRTEKMGDLTCVVGSQLLNEKGIIQSAGRNYCKDGYVENYRNGKPVMDCEASYVRKVDGVEESGMFMSRECWNLWMENKESGKSQDMFCIQMAQKNIPIYYQPESCIITKLPRKKLEENQDLLNLDVMPQTTSDYRGTMIMMDTSIPKYDTNAGARTLDQYIDIFLNDLNMKMYFLPDNFAYVEKYTKRYQQKGICVLYGVEWKEHYQEKLKELVPDLTYAFLNRPVESMKYVDILRENPKMVISYYGVDLHYLRLKRQYEITQEKKYLIQSEEMKIIEEQIINKVDFAGYPSAVEVDYLSKYHNNIQFYPIFYFDERKPITRKTDSRGLLFVGGFAHPPNVDGMLWFADKVYPLLRNMGFSDEVYIVGSNPTKEIIMLQERGFYVTGFVSDETLAQYYENSRIAIAPLRFGAGMKGKVLEALYEGIPMVTTDIGAEGIDKQLSGMEIGNTAEEFAECVMRLYGDDDAINRSSEQEQQFIQCNFTKQQLIELLDNQISTKK